MIKIMRLMNFRKTMMRGRGYLLDFICKILEIFRFIYKINIIELIFIIKLINICHQIQIRIKRKSRIGSM